VELSKEDDSELLSSHPTKGNADVDASRSSVKLFRPGSPLFDCRRSMLARKDALVLLRHDLLKDLFELIVSSDARDDLLRFEIAAFRRLLLKLAGIVPLFKLGSEDIRDSCVVIDFLTDEPVDRQDSRKEQDELDREKNALRFWGNSHTKVPLLISPLDGKFNLSIFFCLSSSSLLSVSSLESGQAMKEPW
jgi:hypothetical protein